MAAHLAPQLQNTAPTQANVTALHSVAKSGFVKNQRHLSLFLVPLFTSNIREQAAFNQFSRF